MKITLTKAVTLGSLCALLAGTTTAAFAQDNNHRDQNGNQGGYSQHQYGNPGGYGQRQDNRQDGDYRRSDQYRHANQSERRRLDRLHAAYARAASHGNYSAAERDHQHAQAIRAQMHNQHQDHGQYQDHRQNGGQYQGDHQNDHRDRHDTN